MLAIGLLKGCQFDMLHCTPNCNGGVYNASTSIKFEYRVVSSTGYRMPTNYSVDLRCRAVWLHLIGKMSYAEIAHTLFLSELVMLNLESKSMGQSNY